MNILYVSHPSERNGTEMGHIHEVLSNLQKQGHNVIGYYGGAGEPVGSSAKAKTTKGQTSCWGAAIKHCAVILRPLYRMFKGELALMYLLPIELIMAIFKVPSIADEKEYVIYSRHRWLNLAEVLWSKAWKEPYIKEVNGFVADEMRIRKAGSRFSIWLFEKIENWNMKRADRWIAVTERMKEELNSRYGVPLDKITVIPNGVNTELFRTDEKIGARLATGLSITGEYICFVGTLWIPDRLLTMMVAMSGVIRSRPDTKFVIVGDGEHMQWLKDCAYNLFIRDKVIFAGKQSQNAAALYMAASDVCIAPFSPERNNTLGTSALKLCEYMACERPVVATRVPGTEFIEDCKAGVLVNDDPEQMARAIVMLLEYPELRIEMGRNGRRYVKENRSWGIVAKRISEVMEEAIA